MNFDELAAFTIHDVKNRLTVLATRAEARGDSETLHGVLEAATTLTGLLVCHRAENGTLDIAIDARTPSDVLHELAAEVGRQTSLSLRVEADGAPTLWFYDESLVRMVLLQAVYNALRYARREVRLGAREREGWLEFSVRDDGPGYPETVLDAPRAAQAVSRDGTGLGLFLADRVAVLHSNGGRQGHIELANDVGAVFMLLLPP